MANTNTGFFETLVSAVSSFNESVQGQCALLGNVYQDVKPSIARVGHQINIPYPDLGAFSDQGVGDWTTTDVDSSNFKSVTFTARPGKAILIRDFEQYQTETNLIEQYVLPLYQRAQEYLNGQIASLVTPGNFPAFSPILAATPGLITPTETLTAWSNMVSAKTPMNNANDLALLTHQDVFRAMMANPQYQQENIVSAMVAQQVRQEGKIPNTFNFRPQFDQQMPSASAYTLHGTVNVTNGSTAVTGYSTSFTVDLTTSNFVVFGNDPTQTVYAISSIASDTSMVLGSTYGGLTATTTVKRVTKLTGTVTTAASTAVTGSGTAFTTALIPGQSLVFSGDTTATPYQIQSITSNTALVLATAYTGTTGAGMTAIVKSYPSLAMHRYSIGVALRNLPSPEMNGLPFPGKWRYVMLGGIPCRLMMSYQHLKSGALLSVDFGYGLAVLRPQFASLILA